MTYWLTVHHPSEFGESHASDLEIWMQEKDRKRPQIHDRMFIYETKRYSFTKMPKSTPKKRRGNVFLKKGAKGIIAYVELSSRVKPLHIKWNKVLYNRIYDVNEIPMKKDVIPYNELDKSFQSKLGKHFTPHINTGLRKLKSNEIDVICNLAGVKP